MAQVNAFALIRARVRPPGVDLFYNLAMLRLAWFSPLPPSRSGIAAYSAELIPLLSGTYAIDTFISSDADTPAFCGNLRSLWVNLDVPHYRSTDFIVRHQAHPYDLIVYHLGNATCHDYMWPYLVRFPGLVVLHDAQLHQARAKRLLTLGRPDEYRAEFAFCHPDANRGIAELVISTLGGSLYFLWPLNRVPIDSARLVAVHTAELASELRETYPSQDFRVVNMGVADPMAGGGRDIRNRHSIPSDALLFAAYGMLTPEKRLAEIFKALRSLLPFAPNAHLLLVGQRADYYDVEADARAIGVAEHVTITEYVSDEELPAYLAAADVCLCLRWPTSRESSASWLRCLAAGKPTVINDLVQNSRVPALDPRTWTPTLPKGSGVTSSDPICVSIDIVDEQHSLGLAMRRLAQDEALRRELGTRARQYWEAHHTLERMAADYRVAIDAALERPAPDRSHLPAHLTQDGTGLTRRILGEFGLSMNAINSCGPTEARSLEP